MNVQQLRYLVAVSDFGSVSAAARSLRVTQPVISRSIRCVRSRTRHDVFCLPADASSPRRQESRRRSARAPSPPSMPWDRRHGQRGQAELVIATTPTNGLLLTSALSDLGRCEPNLEIKVCRASDADDVLRKVQAGEAEIGFAELTRADDRQLIFKPIAEVEVVLVSPSVRTCRRRCRGTTS